MLFANICGSGSERRDQLRASVTRAASVAAVLTALSCGTAKDAPEPIVDYRNIVQNPAFSVSSSPSGGAGTRAATDLPGGTDSVQPSAQAGAGASATGSAQPPLAAGAPSVAASTAGAGAGTRADAVPGAGAAGVGGMTPPPTDVPSQPAAAHPATLSLSFTTKTQRGRYAPKNVGAAWVETPNGKWVHTLEYWAGAPNDAHLTRYNAAGGPNYATSGELARVLGLPAYTTKPPVDVVAGPTLDMHKTHTGAMWTLKDAQGTEVADGQYRVVIELTEVDAAGKSQEIPFTKGPMPVEIKMDYEFYTGVNLTLK